MRDRLWKCTSILALGSLFVAACGADRGEVGAEQPPTVTVPGTSSSPAPPSSDSRTEQPARVEELGQFRGHWDGKKLTFSPIDRAAKVTLRPKSFVDVDDTKVAFTTQEVLVDNPGCPDDPANNYFNSGTHSLSTGSVCPDGHLCALVTLQNNSIRDIDSVFVQITQITPGFVGDGNPLAAVPTGYPLSSSLGLWSYGTLPTGGGGAQVEWTFALPSCDDFSFVAKVMGTVRRTSYIASGQNVTTAGQPEWVDACSLTGSTRILQNAGPGTVVSDIPLPFPFTLYDLTFDTDNLPVMSISSNGALGFSGISGDNVALPDASGNSDYTMFPFWDTLQLGPNGACYGVQGAAPNRKFVVTWVNADIVGTASQENMTFSAVLNETSDVIQFLYSRYSNNQANCTASQAPNRGGSATIGVQGVGTATQFSFNNSSAFPVHTSGCPGSMFKVTLTPQPGNQF